MAKTLPSNAVGAGSIPGQRVRIRKNQGMEQSTIVLNSIRTLKWSTSHKKKNLKKKIKDTNIL